MKRDFQIQFLREVGLQPQHTLFEIGCGTLRGGIPIIDYLSTGNYYGCEVREETLAEGRLELQESGLEGKSPTLLLSPDLGELTVEQKFDYIWAFSVLFHMTDEVLEGCLKFVAGHLHANGAFYANVNLGERPEGHWQGFPVVGRTLDHYQSVANQHGLAVSDIGSLEEVGHVSKVKKQDSQRMLKFVLDN